MIKYKWEAVHIMIILGVIATLTIVTHLTGTPRVQIHSTAAAALLDLRSSRPKAPHPAPSDPREVVVGPTGINNRYTLVSTERKPLSSTVDELIVRLHVVSLATEPLVSPFGSDMLDLSSPGLEPINPKTSFHLPLPAGETRDKEVVFKIPASLTLEKATLDIHYYNYRKQIPISLASRARSD